MSAIDIDLKCSRCGENLRGLELKAACRRCGLGVGYTFNVGLVDEGTLTIREDCACVHCDYNLRTLALRSVCPECGRPVMDSLSGADLRFADPGWLERVRDGTTLILLGMGLPVLVFFVGVAGNILVHGIICPVLMLAAVCVPLSALGLLIGLILVCRTEPLPAPRGGRYAEVVIPALLIVGVFLLLCGAAAGSQLAQDLFCGVGGLCFAGVTLQLAVRVHGLAVRSRRRSFRGLANLWTLCTAALLIFGGITVVTRTLDSLQLAGLSPKLELLCTLLTVSDVALALVSGLLGFFSVLSCRLVLGAVLGARKQGSGDAKG